MLDNTLKNCWGATSNLKRHGHDNFLDSFEKVPYKMLTHWSPKIEKPCLNFPKNLNLKKQNTKPSIPDFAFKTIRGAIKHQSLHCTFWGAFRLISDTLSMDFYNIISCITRRIRIHSNSYSSSILLPSKWLIRSPFMDKKLKYFLPSPYRNRLLNKKNVNLVGDQRARGIWCHPLLF